ncbi:hypothetical protein TKK_0004695 [Trichogramma kaykai]
MTDSDSSFDENFDEEIIIRNFKAESELILNDLLPQKSEERYKLTHQEFIEWQRNNNTTSMAENDLLLRGYVTKKFKVFTAIEIDKFLKSDDSIYLSTKVILIFGICGAMRCKEIVDLKQGDVEDNGKEFVITIKDTKNYYPRIFIIGAKFYSIVKKYVNLRPKE